MPETRTNERADVARRIRLNHQMLVDMKLTTGRLNESRLEVFELDHLKRAEQQQQSILRRHNREPAV